jgi:hypothetical protein
MPQLLQVPPKFRSDPLATRYCYHDVATAFQKWARIKSQTFVWIFFYAPFVTYPMLT